MSDRQMTLTKWVPISGKWEFEGESAQYIAPDDNAPIKVGIALSDALIRSGTVETTVRFPVKARESEGRIVFGYSAQTKDHYVVGMGGHNYAYALVHFVPTVGWLPIVGEGKSDNFADNSEFHILVKFSGQRASLTVNGIRVLEHDLPHPLIGDQVGLTYLWWFNIGDGFIPGRSIHTFAFNRR